jgi:ubiquinone/menaquinone biosynthesis C-methylase UbiE
MKSSEKPAQFDAYAVEYAALVRDPLREKFAESSQFFFERKIDVIRRFFTRSGIDTHTVNWLDAGCGQGDMLRIGQKYFKSAVGCDVSGGMLQSCKDLKVRVQPSPEEIPFDNDSIDLVTAACVYHHIPLDRRLLFTAEILRVLRPGGIFCIIEHNPLNPVTRRIVSRTPVDADAILLRAGASAGLLTTAGARVLDTRYFLYFPQQIHRYMSALENGLSSIPMGGQYAVFASK